MRSRWRHAWPACEHTLRWLNATSVEASPDQVRALAALPFVERLDVVRRYRGDPEVPVEIRAESTADADRFRRLAGPLDYGTSFDQLAQIRVPELHERGLTGAGVVVALFDAGFPISNTRRSLRCASWQNATSCWALTP